MYEYSRQALNESHPLKRLRVVGRLCYFAFCLAGVVH